MELLLYVWIDSNTKQVVDAGWYSKAFHPVPVPEGKRTLVPALLLRANGPTETKALIAKVVGESGVVGWVSTMPTIAWQIAWSSCVAGPCYAAPNPPNPSIAPDV